MTEWAEVAPDVWQARYAPLDVSICAVRGDDGVLLVDTRCNPREGNEIRRDVAALGIGPVRWVANTHAHYDHTFGNQAFSDAVIHGHIRIDEHFRRFEQPRLEAWNEDPAAQPQYDWRDVRLTPPSRAVEGMTRLELGGRSARLINLPPGHTDTDLVVQVPLHDGASVWIVGDVIEESGPPMYGSGAFPFSWPGVVDDLARWIGPDDVVVPGHGQPVGRSFVAEQGRLLRQVANAVRAGFEAGQSQAATADDAARVSGWPSEIVESAVRRGFEELAERQALERGD